MRRAGAAGALAAVLLLAGCSAGGGSSASSRGVVANDAAAPQAAAGAATPGKAATPGAGGAATAGANGAAATDRRIAYQARLTLRVDAVDTARGKAVDLVTAADGYVSGEDLSGGAERGARSVLTLKVPSGSYQKTLDALGGLGARIALSSKADDLTQQMADVDSRVKSMKASVDRVRALMADAKTLSEVVSLESELTRRESDLESLQRQQQELSAKTSLSTITLELTTVVPPEPVAQQHGTGFWGSVGKALDGGWHALLGFFRVVLMVLAALAPFLLVLAPLGWLLRRHLRRRPPRVKQFVPAAPPQPFDPPQHTEE
ncbi:DUF4349 domain-containing protein [Kitasatospora sp. NPDC088134]|uniref:DUF4349 domain-containing protein n=1 Tax=Kitasatospora sp. NPDC088134 TaxID=3364071 RepID=UPI0037FC40CE